MIGRELAAFLLEEHVAQDAAVRPTEASLACCSKRTRVRTVAATLENSETFGWHVAAEVYRRGLDQSKRKACVCDGQLRASQLSQDDRCDPKSGNFGYRGRLTHSDR